MTKKSIININLLFFILISSFNLINTHSSLTNDTSSHQNLQDPSSPPTGFVPYLQIYQSLPTSIKPIAFIFLLFWLLFLFSFLGLVASDFFSPNLSTISSRLGLSESVAGVTLLALGNGAPDVFSTFAAMKAGSGSLAIGELIGAASFIVSVVAGSMSILRPFRVPRHAFLRDTGFFSLAIAFIIYVIHDGQIVRWEANALIVLYLIYVLLVAFGSWFIERKRARRELIRIVRSEYAELGQEIQPYRDDPDFPIQPESELTTESVHSSGLSQSGPFDTSNNNHRSSSPYLSPHGSPQPGNGHYSNSIISSTSTDSIQPATPIFIPNCSPNLTRRMRAPSLSYKTAPTQIFLSQTLNPVFGLQQPTLSTMTTTNVSEPVTENTMTTRRKARAPAAHRLSMRPSILGAIEFRDVVNSLTRDHSNQIQALSLFPPQPLPRPSTLPNSGVRSDPSIPFDTRRRAGSHSGTFGPQNPLAKTNKKDGCGKRIGHRASLSATTTATANAEWAFPPQPSLLDHEEVESVDSSPSASPWSNDLNESENSKVDHRLLTSLGEEEEVGVSIIPSIRIISDEEELSSPIINLNNEEIEIDSKKWYKVINFINPKLIIKIFCPTLKDWKSKSHSGRLAALISLPAIFFLTLTLPVVYDDSIISEGEVEESEEIIEVNDERLIKMDEKIAKCLSIIQSMISPTFTLLVIQLDSIRFYHYIISFIFGLGLSILSLKSKLLLCFIGFIVSLVWILSIVNEVIGVIQALGALMGLSDAILGLTLFAVGNSLGDLVANLTMARMGFPVMAMAACFGGPMLNILLGIGLSSSYAISTNGGTPYIFDSSPTLLVSALGLLLVLVTTLLAVPANGFLLSKTWGACLLGAYLAVLVVNLGVEFIGGGMERG